LLIVGGRNDALDEFILGDLWLLKLSNLEWQQVKRFVKGPLRPRFNHCSGFIGSSLIIAGGIGEGFKLIKDFQTLQLDQAKVKSKLKGKKINIE